MAYTSTRARAPAFGVTRLAAELRCVLRHRRQRHMIATEVDGLSAHMLKDIGISPADREGLGAYAQYRDRPTTFY